MKPSDVGYKETQLILGKHSGRNALLNRLKELNVDVKPKDIERIFSEFKNLADKKKDIYDEDLILLATQKTDEKYQLLDAKIISRMDKKAEAEAIVRIGNKKVSAKAKNGDGPISSLYSAILKATNLEGTLKSFSAHALTADKDAVGIVNIEWKENKGKVWRGQGGDTNVTIAAGKALIDILNRMEIARKVAKSSRK
jgi:2-isopropylmalate synthase